MIKQLAVAVLLLGSAMAFADDKGTEFKFGGDIRERYSMSNNLTFASGAASSESDIVQRMQFHVAAVGGDKFQAYMNFIYNSMWGAAGAPANTGPYNATTVSGQPSTGAGLSQSNLIQMHEAWLLWKLSDTMSLKGGRQTFSYGDGLVFGKNDWLAVPSNYDAGLLRIGMDFADIDVIAAKLNELGPVPPTGTDAETNMYVAYLSFKSLPDVLKKAEVFVAQINGGPGVGGGTYAPAMSAGAVGSYGLTTIGGHVKGDVSMVDYRLDVAFQSGKQNNPGASDITFGGSMYDAQVGVNLADMMHVRIFADYHMDSGNDKSAAGASPDATKNNQYQPLFYDVHSNLAASQFFGWGNLTDISAGASIVPMADSTLGLSYHMLSRTTNNAVATIAPSAWGNAFTFTPAANTSDSALGTEIDLAATHNYGHGFNCAFVASYVSLGQYFKTGGASVGNATQGMLQASYNF